MNEKILRTDSPIAVDCATSHREAGDGQMAKHEIKHKLGGSNHPNGDDSGNSISKKIKQQKDQEL